MLKRSCLAVRNCRLQERANEYTVTCTGLVEYYLDMSINLPINHFNYLVTDRLATIFVQHYSTILLLSINRYLFFLHSCQIHQFVDSGQWNWAVEQLSVLSELGLLLSESACCNLTKFVKEMQLHWQKILLNKLAW